MSHNQIYDIYKDLMPFYAEQTELWFPCGKNTIRVRLKNGNEYVFSYSKNSEWFFETVKLYMNKMKGNKNNVT